MTLTELTELTELTDLTAAPQTTASAPIALPVIIIGAGPVGLAAAAHLIERDIPFRIIERGTTVGAAIEAWGHVRLFSPWVSLIDAAAARLLSATAWVPPEPLSIPFGRDIVASYLTPLAQLPAIASHLSLGAEVISVARKGMDRTRTDGRNDRPFTLVVRGPGGDTSEVDARAVVDASGTWSTPNPITSDGVARVLPAKVARAVFSPLPDVLGRDREAFAGRRVAVVGSGHSAATTLLALAELATTEPGTTISWLMRRGYSNARFGTAGDELRERGALGVRVRRLVTAGVVQVVSNFEIVDLAAQDVGVAVVGSTPEGIRTIEVDAVVAATGFRPDLAPLREIRLGLDEIVEAPRQLAPLIDPNVHSCGTVPPHGVVELTHPERDFYLVGMKSYGRAPTFLLATGYEQVRSVVAEIAGDTVAARRVELTLPATGACSTVSLPTDAGAGSTGCC